VEHDLVSTIIPVYNRPVLLREAVASVLAQTYRPIEILVVDDGSTDDSPDVASRLALENSGEVIVVRQPHAGIAAARNAGLRQARGEFIQFLDADDLLMPGKFARQVEGLAADTDAGISYCYTREYRFGASVDVPARRTAQTFRDLFPDILHGRLWAAPTPLFRRSVTDALGFFRHLSIYEDWEYECRAAARGVKLHHCREFLADKRDVHALEGRRKGGVPIEKLADYVEVHALILGYARQASADAIDLDRFATKLFGIARRCAAEGLDAEAKRCLGLAIEASVRPARMRVYRRASQLCGWRTVGSCVETISSGVARSEAIVSGARAAVPAPLRRPLGSAARRGATYLRGKRIARRFAAHHREAQRLFARDGNAVDQGIRALSEVGVALVHPGSTGNLIDVPADYLALVSRVAKAAGTAFERSEAQRSIRSTPDTALPDVECAGDHADVIAIQLTMPLGIDGLEELARPIVHELERKVFGSYAIVDKVYVYRSPVTRAMPRASWVWHYDNHPREVLKVMIYLTDVTESTAPFEYLRNTTTATAALGRPIAPLHGRSRLDPATVERWLRNGHQRCVVTGLAGTTIVFDDNVIHRGTLARDAHRDVLVLQVRPVTFCPSSCVDPRWTGSFPHVDISRDPYDITPRVKN